MSLKEAYSLAHTAQCRLAMEAGRPERNLRFVVGHLMHYESLRLRIVEIEHDISKSQRAKAVAFKGTGHVEQDGLRRKPSTGQLGRKSPPPQALPDAYAPEDDDDDEDDQEYDDDMDDEDDGLGLQRFPSGAARLPRPPPDLLPDDGEDDDDDYDSDPETPPDSPPQETLEKVLQTEDSPALVSSYEGVRKCPCHRHYHDAPQFEKMWELPKEEGQKEGVTRAVAQVFV